METNLTKAQINKVIQERHNWLKQDHFRVAKIMYDKSDDTLWTDCFLDCNQWEEYHSNDIIDITLDVSLTAEVFPDKSKSDCILEVIKEL